MSGVRAPWYRLGQLNALRARVRGILPPLILGLAAGRYIGGSPWGALAIAAAATLGLWLVLEVGLGGWLDRRRARRGTAAEPFIQVDEWAIVGCIVVGSIAAVIVDGSLLDRFAICLGLTAGLVGVLEAIRRSMRAERPVTGDASEGG